MRILAAVALAACSSTAQPDTATLTAGVGGIMTAVSDPAGIDCPASACAVVLPFDSDASVTVHNTSPQTCYLWGCTVTPKEAGTCTVTGTTGTAHVRMIADVTISAGGCYNP